MSFWTCPSCTFVNEAKDNACSMCSLVPRPIKELGRDRKWGCRACTYLNTGANRACDMCGTPKSDVCVGALLDLDPAVDEELEEGASEGSKFWPLRSCARHESGAPDGRKGKTAVDGTVSSAITSTGAMSRLSIKRKAEDYGDNQSEDSAVSSLGEVSNGMLGQLHLERVARTKAASTDDNKESISAIETPSSFNAGSSSGDQNQSVVILTYNIWFREDVEVLGRMNAIGFLIQEHRPHFICLQEVTPNIFQIFQQSAWWREYRCSITYASASKRAYFCIQLSRIHATTFSRNPFKNSMMGRELCMAEAEMNTGAGLVVATTHLESPCPAPPTWNQMFSPERVWQAKEAFNLLKGLPNVVFGGDMNWDDGLDGAPPLPEGWDDAWLKLQPGKEGLTYDSNANPMLTGSRLRKRLDRIFCKLQDFELESIDMLGTKPIPGLTYLKEKKVKKQVQQLTLPVLPSDHFALLLKIRPRCG